MTNTEQLYLQKSLKIYGVLAFISAAFSHK